MTEKLAYGYLVEHPMVETVLRKELGEMETNEQEKVSIFIEGCREAISPILWPSGLKFELRGDIDDSEYNEDTLRGFLILVANRQTRAMPPKEELARLEAYLETNAKPQWCKIL